MMHMITSLGGGAALAALLMTAAMLGGPVWGTALAVLAEVLWTIAVLLLGLTQIDMLAMLLIAAVLVTAEILRESREP